MPATSVDIEPVCTAMYTLGQIARELCAPEHRVLYAIKSRSIQPVARVGRFRVFGRAEIARIGQALASIDSRSSAAATAGQ